MLKDYLSSFAPQLHGHVELRAQISTSHAVAMLNGDLQSNARAQQGGVSARVYRNGVYGFASAVEYEEESVRRVLKAAEENALFLDARVKKNRPALPVLPSGMVAKDKEYIEVPQKDYIEFVRAADDYLKQKYPNLLSRRVLLRHDCMEKLLTVSDGTNSHSVRPRTHLVVQLTADAPDGMPVEIIDVLGGGEGVLTDHFTDPSEYYDKLDEQVEQLMKMCGLYPEMATHYPHQFSGGQRQRICIARALATDPEFVVCDEAVSALDVSIQAQIINLLKDLQDELKLTYLFISHDLNIVHFISDEIIVMYLGQVVERGTMELVYKNRAHPYTKALFSATPAFTKAEKEHKSRIILQGDVPSPVDPAPGCRFRTRCPYAKKCCEEEPQWHEIEENHFVKCHLFD